MGQLGLSMRLLTAFWWIFALLISQTYIAKLAAFITSSKIAGEIDTLHDLVDQNKVQFGTIRGGATSVYFSESNDTENRMAWNKMLSFKPDSFTRNNEEGVDRVKLSKGTYAFLMETTNLQYYVQRNFELTQIGESFGEKHYGIAVPLICKLEFIKPGFSRGVTGLQWLAYSTIVLFSSTCYAVVLTDANFRSNLSVGILKLSEKGVLYNLRNKWFNSNKSTSDLGGSTNDDGQFDMDSVGGLFVVLIVGVTIAFVIGIVEFLRHVQQLAVKEKIPFMLTLMAELNFLIRFWLTKKPLHTYRQNWDSSSTGYSSMQQISIAPSVKKANKITEEKACKH